MTTANKLLTTINYCKSAGQSILFLVPNKMDVKELTVILSGGSTGLLVKANNNNNSNNNRGTNQLI